VILSKRSGSEFSALFDFPAAKKKHVAEIQQTGLPEMNGGGARGIFLRLRCSE
jgi:hypothetical protein